VMVGSAGRLLGSRLFSRALNGVTGAVLIAFGIKLALERPPA